jgi:hypothetical protein
MEPICRGRYFEYGMLIHDLWYSAVVRAEQDKIPGAAAIEE